MLLIFLSTNRLGSHPLKVEIWVRVPIGGQLLKYGFLNTPKEILEVEPLYLNGSLDNGDIIDDNGELN